MTKLWKRSVEGAVIAGAVICVSLGLGRLLELSEQTMLDWDIDNDAF